MIKKATYGAMGVMASGLLITVMLINKPTEEIPRNHAWDAEAHLVDDSSLIGVGVDGDLPMPLFTTYHVSNDEVSNLIDVGAIEFSTTNPMYYWNFIEEDYEIGDEEEDSERTFKWSEYEAGIVEAADKAAALRIDERTEAPGKGGQTLIQEVSIAGLPARLSEFGQLPVDAKNYNVVSGFGPRQDPFNKDMKAFHAGIDIAVANMEGEPIYSVLPGEVAEVGYREDGYGHYIAIDHDGIITLYSHMMEASTFKVGQIVSSEDIIGKIGTTGRSTGPHLHFETIVDGHRIDSQRMLDYVTGDREVIVDETDESSEENNEGIGAPTTNEEEGS